MAIGKGKRRIMGISSVGETATFFLDGEGPGVNKKVVASEESPVGIK